MWVIQEVANSQDAVLHIGTIECPWEWFSTIIINMRSFRLDGFISETKGTKAIAMMNHLREERVTRGLNASEMPFLDLLEELRDFKVTIGSDKIYGILGLTDQMSYSAVDYGKTSEEVFMDFAIGQLEAGSLDILTHCVDSSKPKDLNLPSWVPDWTRPGWVEPLRVRGLMSAAAGNTVPRLNVDKNSGVLKIWGRALGRIAAVETEKKIPKTTPGPFEPDPKEVKDLFDPQHRLQKMQAQHKEDEEKAFRNIVDIAYPEKIATPQTSEALWRTFMCNRTRDNEVPGDCSKGLDMFLRVAIFHETISQMLQERTAHQVSHHGLLWEESTTYYQEERRIFEEFSGAYWKWCHNRRFFRSDAGRYGWTVDGTEPGDLVVMFYGTAYPFVVREDVVDGFRILGDCYIHGLMDGEGLADEFEEKEFCII
jgi:hypothetical protein